jgi:hypothetical protein
MNKRELEEHILKLAGPLIKRLYGCFDVDRDQTDRPDAAIDVKKPTKHYGRKRVPFKVGIEITTVDKMESLEYLKDKKFGKHIINDLITNALENSEDDKRPLKKIDVSIDSSYIFDGVTRKSDKYSNYTSSGVFREVILLCFSEVVCSRSVIFEHGLRDWTNFLLSKNNYPFDKVLFVDLCGGDPVRVYDKRKPLLVSPSQPMDTRKITIAKLPFMRVDKEYNTKEISLKCPLIPQKRKRR